MAGVYTCIIHVVIHMYYMCRDIHVWNMCITGVYTYITGVWITCVIHIKHHTCITRVLHIQHTCGTYGSVVKTSDNLTMCTLGGTVVLTLLWRQIWGHFYDYILWILAGTMSIKLTNFLYFGYSSDVMMKMSYFGWKLVTCMRHEQNLTRKRYWKKESQILKYHWMSL